MGKLLNEAAQYMFKAVRSAGSQQVINEKKQQGFKDRLDSTLTLTKAYHRIVKEKQKNDKKTRLERHVQDMLQNAQTLHTRGFYYEGREILDSAHELVKISIEKVRGGITLFRSLDFKSAADEYRYEIDRNDTHNMLLKILLDEKMPVGKIRQTVFDNIEEAKKLRKKAEQTDATGDHKQAIQLLEQSTRQFIHAIRMAGVNIPG